MPCLAFAPFRPLTAGSHLAPAARAVLGAVDEQPVAIIGQALLQAVELGAAQQVERLPGDRTDDAVAAGERETHGCTVQGGAGILSAAMSRIEASAPAGGSAACDCGPRRDDSAAKTVNDCKKEARLVGRQPSSTRPAAAAIAADR